MPPVDAFWSLTMYDVPKFLLVSNPIDRYSIGDRTPGLHVVGDGSLTIYLQHESPGPDKESNWLPTPTGDFRPVASVVQYGYFRGGGHPADAADLPRRARFSSRRLAGSCSIRRVRAAAARG
jgi:Protein of unknown function (DUF1214)